MRFLEDESFNAVAKLKVIGVGGGGGNAVNRMVEAGLSDVEFIVVNTDAAALDRNLAKKRMAIGKELTGGLGAGANPAIGRQAMEEDRESVKTLLEGAHMLFIAAGMGGGTGTGGAPVVAEIAKELGILTVAIVTRPFIFEGKYRDSNASSGIEELRKHVDTIIVIPNQKLLSITDQKTTLLSAFKSADEVLYQGVKGISDVITRAGEINVDFADVKTIMKGMGDAIMGAGYASSDDPNRAVTAIESAIQNPLLDDISIAGARGMLINFTGGDDITLYEVNEAAERARQHIGENVDTNIIFGTVIDPEMKDQIKVTVIATGFNNKSAPMPLQKEERYPSLPKAALPARENKVEQTALDLTAAASKSTPIADTAAPVPMPESAAFAQPATVTATADVGVVVNDKRTENYRTRDDVWNRDMAMKARGMPPLDSYEYLDTPTYLRKQQQ